MATIEQVKQQQQLHRLKLMQIRMQYQVFLQTRVEEKVEEVLVKPIKNKMKSAGYSQKIIDGTELEFVVVRGKQIRIRIKSEYFADNGFDVAVAVERGTRRHRVEPKKSPTITGKLSGAFQEKEALHWKEDGENRFSKGHMVGGIKKHHIIRDTIRENKEKLQNAVSEELEKWTQEILKT